MTNTSAPSFVTSTSNRVWVIDDDVALRTILQDALTDAGFEVQTFGQAKLAWQTLENLKHHQTTNNLPNVIITDIRMPMMDGLSFSEKMREHFPTIPVIIIGRCGSGHPKSHGTVGCR
jgi:two-component system nitrogen regulation response regulator GlnG